MKKTSFFLTLLICICVFVSCDSKNSYDGTYVICEVKSCNGTVTAADELNYTASYIISGDSAQYIFETSDGEMTNYDMTIIAEGDNKYDFCMGNSFVFSTGEFTDGLLVVFTGDGGTVTFIKQ